MPTTKKPKTASRRGMAAAVHAAIAAKKSDAQIVAALKQKFPALTPRNLRLLKASFKRRPKVTVVKKLPAPVAARKRGAA